MHPCIPSFGQTYKYGITRIKLGILDDGYFPTSTLPYTIFSFNSAHITYESVSTIYILSKSFTLSLSLFHTHSQKRNVQGQVQETERDEEGIEHEF